MDFFEAWCYDRPAVSLVLGPRGGGKSYLAALATFWDSATLPGHGTRILGGSLAQSEQVYNALVGFTNTHAGRLRVRGVTKQTATFVNGSDVSLLAASSRSVRGPHVPTLRLDEIDEIDPDVRESAMGMCMARGDTPASVSMTSTWHRVGGPMAGLIDRARGGEFPLWSFCTFEVLERCPESRSGPALENCPACPLVRWCHDDRGPKAKRAAGHYAIDALIQKTLTVSLRVFEADYLCVGPRADGVWFPSFTPATHVSPTAEYDPALPVTMAIDSGVFTGAVLFQVRKWTDHTGSHDEVRVFSDYLNEGGTAEGNARALIELARVRCNGRLDVIATDPAGGARNPVGPTVLAEYERAGLKPLRRWPVVGVSDGLSLLDSFIRPASGPVRLLVHPRCTNLIAALSAYRRAKRAGQWQDYPEDPQHPAEDLVDALRGGLCQSFPGGRREPAKPLTKRSAFQVLY
jgi:hypothetical protein